MTFPNNAETFCTRHLLLQHKEGYNTKRLKGHQINLSNKIEVEMTYPNNLTHFHI
jgi:hypothetical protein